MPGPPRPAPERLDGVIADRAFAARMIDSQHQRAGQQRIRARREVGRVRSLRHVDNRAKPLRRRERDVARAPLAGIAPLVLRVAQESGRSVGPQTDLDHLPVALVFAEPKEVLWVVVQPEPVLEPGAAVAAVHDSAVDAPCEALRGLHPASVALEIRGEGDRVVAAGRRPGRIGAQPSQRKLGCAADPREHFAVVGAQDVAGILDRRLDREEAVVVLGVETEQRFVALEQDDSICIDVELGFQNPIRHAVQSLTTSACVQALQSGWHTRSCREKQCPSSPERSLKGGVRRRATRSSDAAPTRPRQSRPFAVFAPSAGCSSRRRGAGGDLGAVIELVDDGLAAQGVAHS